MLARAMTNSLRAHRGAKRILEVGPGTGPFTAQILRALRGHDALDIVELNPIFCEHLEVRLLRKFRAHHPAIPVRLHSQAIEHAPLEGEYDFVICGLPFNNFPLALTQSIFHRLFELMRDGAEMTYFEYAGVRRMKAPFVGSSGRDRIRRFEAFKSSTAKSHKVTRELVVANLPPAHAVRIIKRKGGFEQCFESTKTF